MYDGEKILWLTFFNFLCFHPKLIKYYRIIYHLSGVLTETGYFLIVSTPFKDVTHIGKREIGNAYEIAGRD